MFIYIRDPFKSVCGVSHVSPSNADIHRTFHLVSLEGISHQNVFQSAEWTEDEEDQICFTLQGFMY